ncbi:von Willebrand factor D and EGF domain-containing protein-like [Argopecten irradians]|uniref:von Willebrand factor D and EGF domain-containing protein-like n=1 Tax=Argopecten irradians TaxID=31199 RepID=UPI003711B121
MIQYGLFLLGIVYGATADVDPCQEGRHVIMDDPTRFTTYVTDPSSAECGDIDIVVQWYRIPFGFLATTPPPLNRCGTRYPVWVTPETLPAIGESSLGRICLRTTSDNCRADGSIEVKNCGSFYVYELVRLNSYWCPLGYCLEADSSILVLPSVTPSLTDDTTVVDGNEYSSKTILFTCTMEANTGVDRTALFYDVIWYINGREVKRRTALTYTTLQSDGTLRENEWTTSYTLAMQIACAVEAMSTASTGTGNFEKSAPFFAGIVTELSADTLQENGELELRVRITVPIGCMYDPRHENNIKTYEQNNCFLYVRVVRPEPDTDLCTLGGLNSHTLIQKGCGIHIYHTDWTATHVITVRGSPDNIVNSGYRLAKLQLRTDQVFIHETWTNVLSDNIEIHVHDDDVDLMGKLCYSSNDPHMSTFDGRNFELQKSGEYVLYKHDSLMISIHAFFQRCVFGWSHATCNCAIAIRYKNSVFRVNYCKHSSNGFNSAVEFNSCDTEDTMTIKSFQSRHTFGSGFQIVLPSGTMVNFRYGSYSTGGAMFIHYILIKPSVIDWMASTGLCGHLNGTIDDDFIMKDGSQTDDAAEFSNSWKIPSGSSESLFKNRLEQQPIPSTGTQHTYCTCNDVGEATCSNSPAKPCSSASSSTNNRYVGFLDTCHRVTKRDTDHTDQETTVYIPSWPNLEEGDDPETETRDWSGDWTEASAAEACRNFFRTSPLVQTCERVVPGFHSEVYVPDCTKDIKLTGSTMFMESTLNLLQTACISEAERLENLTNERTDRGVTILEDLLSISCLNNCSNVGTCVNGTCECEAGYDGIDCSESGDIPPYLPQNRNIGMCDLSINVCSKLVVSGENFAAAELMCKAQRFKLDGDVVEMEGGPVTFSGTYVNSYLAVCSILASRKRRSTSTDKPTGYKISMSNDRTTFSDEITFIIYNFNCFECNITALRCTEKQSESCNQQTVDDVSTVPDDSNSPAIGIAVGVSMAALVVVLVTICYRLFLKKSVVAAKLNFEAELDDGISLYNEEPLIISVGPMSYALPQKPLPAWEDTDISHM